MAAQVWIDLERPLERRRRLAVVYAVELRLKIVTELFMREMSPSQFREEFGGGSLSRVTQNFERLEKTGSLRQVRTDGPGGKRHGGKEHFYRTTELAILDHDTWSTLPYSARAAFSWTALKQMGERWRDALEHKTFDSQPDRRASHTTVLVDQQGWDHIRKAQDTLFSSLFEEQEDSRRRVAHTGDELMLTVVALLGFESSKNDDREYPGADLPCLSREPDTPFALRFSKILEDDLYLQILTASGQEPISAKSFCTTYGGKAKSIRDRIALLRKYDWMMKDFEKTGGKRRGAAEKFYRATTPALDPGDSWIVSASVKKSSSWKTFEGIADVAMTAMRTGAFDARLDRHTTWSLLRLDRQGWKNVVTAMEAFRSLVLKEQRRARERMERSGEKAICMTVGEAAFEASGQQSLEP